MTEHDYLMPMAIRRERRESIEIGRPETSPEKASSLHALSQMVSLLSCGLWLVQLSDPTDQGEQEVRYRDAP